MHEYAELRPATHGWVLKSESVEVDRTWTSAVAALNWLAESGWEVVTVYLRSAQSDLPTYLLRRSRSLSD